MSVCVLQTWDGLYKTVRVQVFLSCPKIHEGPGLFVLSNDG